MNSLLGGLGNALFNTAKPASMMQQTTQMPNILLSALGAAMRGESPQVFMQNLATQHPQLRQLDLSNLQNTAQQVCQQNGINMQDAVNKLDNTVNSLINKK